MMMPQVPLFEKKLLNQKLNKVQIEFAIDTFRIERFMEKLGRLNLTDAEMSDADYAEAKGYDSLLNKYYKKLLAVLKPDDKKVLIQAQKSWLSFRDAEYELAETIQEQLNTNEKIYATSIPPQDLPLIVHQVW
jgi:hypothetical protein